MQYRQLPEAIRAEMRKLQKQQNGFVNETIFDNKLTACKMEVGIDWPKDHYEEWSDALRDGKPDRLLRLLTKTRVAKPNKPKDVNDPDTRRPFESPEDAEKRVKANRKYTKKEVWVKEKEDADQVVKLEKPKYTRKPTVKVDKADNTINPVHYQQPDGAQVLDMMLAVYGPEAVKQFCVLNAFKYRMRAGRKSKEAVESDIAKAMWYEEKAEVLCGAAV